MPLFTVSDGQLLFVIIYKYPGRHHITKISGIHSIDVTFTIWSTGVRNYKMDTQMFT